MKLLFKSFRFAINGIVYCIRNERNARIHVTIMLYVFLLSRFYRLTATQWMILFLTVAFVISAEIINTAIETIVNLLSPSYDQLAKIAKDAAAGAVLVAATAAVAVGAVLFLRVDALVAIFCYFKRNLVMLGLFLISLVVAGFFVFGGPNSMQSYAKRFVRKRKEDKR